MIKNVQPVKPKKVKDLVSAVCAQVNFDFGRIVELFLLR
jgi:hypothetical protein